MAIPDYQTLMRPLLVCLKDGEPSKIAQVSERLSDEFGLSEEERHQTIPSGGSTLIRNRVGWARTYLKQAGLVSSPQRGIVQITELGRRALADCPERVDNRYLKQFPSFQEFLQIKSRSGDTAGSGAGPAAIANIDEQLMDPLERLEQAHVEFQSSLAQDLLQTVKEQSPEFFEKLVVDLMLAMGYGGWSKESGRATQYSADGGIDGIINEDPLGLETIYLQAKRYTTNSVGRPDLQAFVGALEMNRARKGVFITTSRFSREATEYIVMIEKKVVLIDGQQLAELMIKHSLGVSTRAAFEVKAIDSDFFGDE